MAAHGLVAADGSERSILEVVRERAADQPELLLERLGAQTPLVEIAVDRVAARQSEIRRGGAVALDVLREDCQAQRELVGRLHEQIRASAVDVRFVHVVAAIGKVVDEAAVVGVEAAHAKRGLIVGERSIDRGGGIVADAATRGIHEPARAVAPNALTSGSTLTYLSRPPIVLAPYSVPCGPRRISIRDTSNSPTSSASCAPDANGVLEP